MPESAGNGNTNPINVSSGAKSKEPSTRMIDQPSTGLVALAIRNNDSSSPTKAPKIQESAHQLPASEIKTSNDSAGKKVADNKQEKSVSNHSSRLLPDKLTPMDPLQMPQLPTQLLLLLQERLVQQINMIEMAIISGQVKVELPSSSVRVLKKELKNQNDLYKQAKVNQVDEKRRKLLQEKEEQEKKNREAEDKVNKWKEEHKLLHLQKLTALQKKAALEAEERDRLLKEEDSTQMFLRLEKQKIIEQRIKQMAQQKERRERQFKQGQLPKQMPLFELMEQRHKQHMEELKFETEIAKKNHKMSMMLDHQMLKQHSQKYLEQVETQKRELKIDQPPRPQSKEFQLLDQHYNSETQLQKMKRRRAFQQKIKQIPVEINEAKKMEIQIAKDKSKNPLKYNFLGQKALNDFQIFGQFKDFQVNTNHRELGNSYLEQVHTIVGQSRIKGGDSAPSRKSSEEPAAPRYRDYLLELRQKNEIESRKKALTDRSSSKTGQIGSSAQSSFQLQGSTSSHRMPPIRQNSSPHLIPHHLLEQSRSLLQQAELVRRQSLSTRDVTKMVELRRELDQKMVKSISARLKCLEAK